MTVVWLIHLDFKLVSADVSGQTNVSAPTAYRLMGYCSFSVFSDSSLDDES